MKKITLILALIIISGNAFSQVVTENINFDNYLSASDNDFSNNFNKHPEYLMRQITTNGITGGSLPLPPNHNTSKEVTYCSKYKNVRNSDMITSMSFKYKSALKNSNFSLSALRLQLQGNVKTSTTYPVHFVVDNQTPNSIFIAINSTIKRKNVSLIDNHWYKMTATLKSIGGSSNNESFANIELFDLGINGNDTPTSIGNETLTIYDKNLVESTEFTVSFVSHNSSGTEYLDNFTFSGEKSGSLCNSLGINDNKLTSNIELYPNPIYDILKIKIPEFSNKNKVKVEIYNVFGKVIYTKPILEILSEINLSTFSNGIYFVKIIDNEGITNSVKKIIKK